MCRKCSLWKIIAKDLYIGEEPMKKTDQWDQIWLMLHNAVQWWCQTEEEQLIQILDVELLLSILPKIMYIKYLQTHVFALRLLFKMLIQKPNF